MVSPTSIPQRLTAEGVNGRLPNQDVINTVAHIARHAGGAPIRYHDLPDTPGYVAAAQRLLAHAYYLALGRPSAAHGLLARHRIDAVTLYCTPATGPHGFYTLGRTLESTMRSFNNLLERLYASYFYLLSAPDHFIPVGHYLPAAVLLGASITLGGFDCPRPFLGVLWLLPATAMALLS
jgi:glycosylphosphatidylinositol transamidase